MSQGVVMFAHNNGTTDYYVMAAAAAERASRFLNLPVSIITDQQSISQTNFKFDQTFLIEPDTTNQRKHRNWYNKGRYKVYELSPYDETLVLDTDYLVNSDRLLTVFDLEPDFVCHGHCYWPCTNQPTEYLNPTRTMGVTSAWATVMRFRKTQLSQDIFHMIQMVQNNYEHYSNIYGFLPSMYRNDYALAIALKTVHGHWPNPEYFLSWPLAHIDLGVKVKRLSDTRYSLTHEPHGERAQYIEIQDFDFHVLDKDNFLELLL